MMLMFQILKVFDPCQGKIIHNYNLPIFQTSHNSIKSFYLFFFDVTYLVKCRLLPFLEHF